MRGDVAVTFRLALRRTGLAGLAAMVGGVSAVVAALLPWHEVVATVEMLGAASSRSEARTAGLPGWWWGWCSLTAGIAAAWLGAGIAFDRPVRWARTGLAFAAALLVLAAGIALVLAPDVAAITDPATTLARAAHGSPWGVEIDLGVRPSMGPWVSLLAAGLIAAGAAGSREA